MDSENQIIVPEKQISSLTSAKEHPFHLIPLTFYNPRRWRFDKISRIPINIKNTLEYGTWDEPFKEIAAAWPEPSNNNRIETSSGIFIGFKMYPPLGHKPLDELCEYLPEYYHRCQKEQVPILTHCSPGGMTTHEIDFYKEFDEANRALRAEMKLKQFQKLHSLRNACYTSINACCTSINACCTSINACCTSINACYTSINACCTSINAC